MRQVLVKFQDERFGRVGLTVTTITSLETSISDKFKGEWFGKVGFKVTTSISLEENILDKFEAPLNIEKEFAVIRSFFLSK